MILSIIKNYKHKISCICYSFKFIPNDSTSKTNSKTN